MLLQRCTRDERVLLEREWIELLRPRYNVAYGYAGWPAASRWRGQTDIRHARPEPGSDTPNLDDAAFKAGDAFDDTAHTDNYTSGDGNWVLDYGCLKFGVNRLTGGGIGPEVFGRYDLSADVTFTTSARCGRFDYGNGATNGRPS